jgi:hypothetical protein
VGPLEVLVPAVRDIFMNHLDVVGADIHYVPVHHRVVWASPFPLLPRQIAQAAMQVDYWDTV